jgi:hypothetical protein
MRAGIDPLQPRNRGPHGCGKVSGSRFTLNGSLGVMVWDIGANRPVVVVWDHLPFHRSALVTDQNTLAIRSQRSKRALSEHPAQRCAYNECCNAAG